MRVFFVEVKDNKVFFGASDEHHITSVLRKKINSKVKCCNPKDSTFFDVKIVSIKPLVGLVDESSIKKKEIFDSNITCYLGVIKKNNFELAVEKLNEIGIKKIVPILFERSQKNIHLDFARLNKICHESSKQCNRINPIIVGGLINFFDMISELKNMDEIYVAHIAKESIKLCYLNKLYNKKNIAYVVGPEGGFSQKEIECFKTVRNLKFLRLTDNILKTETAAIYLASILYERESNEK